MDKIRLKDIRRFCIICGKELHLSEFEKTGLAGLHDQYKFIKETCPGECFREKLRRQQPESEDDGIQGVPI
jgi:hypothetical protein